MSHERFVTCIEACNACAVACDHCTAACLRESDPKALARCIALDVDCASICQVAAGYMSRSSELAAEICGFCAEVCEACQAECEKHDMDHCRECAEACKRCAEECRRMSGAEPGRGDHSATARPAH